MAALLSTKDVLKLSDQEILAMANQDVKERLGRFIREFNKREWSVRIGNLYNSFEHYADEGYIHLDEFGYGFVVDEKPVPYFHPNRSFHDEIIWLNDHLYYKNSVTFGDKLVNSAIVKFYGPARTLDIITGHEYSLDYLVQTDSKYINFDRLKTDPDYEYTLMSNLEKAFARGEKIWGTTELRTSLQTASRNHCRENPSVIDLNGVEDYFGPTKISDQLTRKMRPSDMIAWVKHMSDEWIAFYQTGPTMKESFEFLTKTRGIGNYYGYHFSSNLARMPGIGASQLIEAEYGPHFAKLKENQKDLDHGNLDENADYVVAGPGAMITLNKLYKDKLPINVDTAMRIIIAIRNHQEEFFGIAGNPDAELHLKEASELGRFTTFGIEISCCQFSVFERALADQGVAKNRANAPISKIAKSNGGLNLDADCGTTITETTQKQKSKYSNLIIF